MNDYSDENIIKPNQFNLPAHIEQIILVTALRNSSNGYLYTFQKENTSWAEVFSSIPVVIGKTGMTADKNEGDKKSPLGLHKIGHAFGIDRKPDYVKLPYKEIRSSDKFIDDPESSDYNTWVTGETKAKSYERMKRSDGMYDLGVIIEYNMNPVIPKKGSAIFMHIWQSSNRATLGCVAMSRPDLEDIVAWLDPKYSPYIYILES